MNKVNTALPNISSWRKWLLRICLVAVVLSIILIVTTFTLGQFAIQELQKEYPPSGKLVDMGGYNLHLDCKGEGSPTIILEAGLNEFSLTWHYIHQELAKYTRTCAYDRAGLGWSDSSNAQRTSETLVTELHDLLQSADIESPYLLVGHSYGGVLARLYTYHYPSDVVGIVLIDATHEDMFTRMPEVFKSSTEQLIQQFQTLVALSRFGLLALSTEQIPVINVPDGVHDDYRAILASPSYFEGAVAETQAFEESLSIMADYDSSLENLPLTIISRGQSEPLPFMLDDQIERLEMVWAELQLALLDLSTNSRHIIVENSGHYIHISEPALVIDAVRDMLDIVQSSD